MIVPIVKKFWRERLERRQYFAGVSSMWVFKSWLVSFRGIFMYNGSRAKLLRLKEKCIYHVLHWGKTLILAFWMYEWTYEDMYFKTIYVSNELPLVKLPVVSLQPAFWNYVEAREAIFLLVTRYTTPKPICCGPRGVQRLQLCTSLNFTLIWTVSWRMFLSFNIEKGWHSVENRRPHVM